MSDSKWDLNRLNTGELSALRRAAGKTVLQAEMSALRAFYRACGYCEPRKEEYWFPAVCMDALWRDGESLTIKPMSECIKALQSADEKTTESMRHRVDMLLETSWDADGYLIGKMLNIVKIIKSKTALKPDFQALADDWQRWNFSDRRVQRTWLRTLYNVNNSKTEEEE